MCLGGSIEPRSATGMITRVDVRANAQQARDDRIIASARSLVQRCPTVLILTIWMSARVQQKSDSRRIIIRDARSSREGRIPVGQCRLRPVFQ